MIRTPASLYDVESLVARRARTRADGRPLRPSEREEPKYAPAEPVADSDLADVVERFEQVYAKIGTEQGSRHAEVDLAGRASDVFFDRVASSAHDTFDTCAEPAMTSTEPAAASTPAPAIDRFEFPETEILSVAQHPHVAAAPRDLLPARAPRSSRRTAIAGICAALVVGTAIGFLMAPNREPAAARAQIEASDHGGTRLRLDYRLPNR